MKRIFALLVAFCVIFAFAACGGSEGKDGTEAEVNNEDIQGLSFVLKQDGSYAVEIGDAKNSSRIVIPNTYDGKAVSEVGRFGFDNGSNTVLKEVVISEGIKIIGEKAFSGCSALTSVTIPDSVTTIGNGAFSGCTSLQSIALPDSITSIGDYAFASCSGLQSITLPDGIKSTFPNSCNIDGDLYIRKA